MDIITGYTGTPHITAENDRDINIGIFGSKSYVLQTGTMLTAEISNNNEIKVRDGVIMHQGCAASIKKNTYDSVTINNGSQGMKRIDLLVARYEKQPETNVESLTLKVLQGTPVETSPQVPEHTEGDIQVGDTVADMPLYEVEIDGLNITEIRKVFQTMGDLESVNGNSYKLYTGLLGGISTRPYVLKKYNDGTFELCGNLDASAVRLQYSNSSKVYFTTISAPIPEELTIDLDKRTQFSGSVESEGIYYLSANELTATTLTVYLSAMNYISEIHYIASGFILKGWWK